MKRYEQGNFGMRPDKEGAWCAYDDVSAELANLTHFIQSQEIIINGKEEEIMKLREENLNLQRGLWPGESEEITRLRAEVESARADERERCANLYDHPDVLAPVGQSPWGEAYQEGWIAGCQAYRDAIRRGGGVMTYDGRYPEPPYPTECEECERLRAKVERCLDALDVGIYLMNNPDGTLRTEWQEGWNAAVIEIVGRMASIQQEEE